MKNNIFKVWFLEFRKPWIYINFYGYLIISIFFGGFGVFYTIWSESNATVFNSWKVAENLITYSLAILFPSLIYIYGDDVDDVKGRNIWTIIVFIAIPSIKTFIFVTIFGLLGAIIYASFIVILYSLIFFSINYRELSGTLARIPTSFATYPETIFSGAIKILFYTIFYLN